MKLNHFSDQVSLYLSKHIAIKSKCFLSKECRTRHLRKPQVYLVFGTPFQQGVFIDILRRNINKLHCLWRWGFSRQNCWLANITQSRLALSACFWQWHFKERVTRQKLRSPEQCNYWWRTRQAESFWTPPRFISGADESCNLLLS